MAGRITIDGLSDSLKDYIESLGLTEEQVNQLIDKFKNENIGDLSTLSTQKKTVVGAINEVANKANNAATKTDVGDKTTLKTTAKGNLVSAVNEISDKANTHATKTEVNTIIDGKGYQTESQVQATVDELQEKLQGNGGYNLVYNGDFRREFECWEPNSAYWQYGDQVTSTSGRCIYCDGALNSSRTTYCKNGIVVEPNADTYTLSYWIYTTSNGSDGTTNVYRHLEVTVYYTDGTATWYAGWDQTNFETWEKQVITINRPANKKFDYFTIGLWCRDTTKRVHYADIQLEKGSTATEWTPNPKEICIGNVNIDKHEIKVKSSNINTTTEIDSDSFRVVDNASGGTVAEFSKTANIPNLTSGTINAQNIYANNLPGKENYSDIHFIYVNGSTGSDTNNGTSGSPYKTVQRALNDVSDVQNTNVTIYVYNSVPGFTVRGFTGAGVITLSLQDSAIINTGIWLHGVNCRVNITNESGSRKATLKAGLSIDDCRCVDLYALTFRGVNSAGNNISVYNTNYCAVNGCDLGGMSDKLMCAIAVQSSLLWIHGCIGSNITDVVGQYPFSHVMTARAGDSTCPDYSSSYLCNYDGAGRIQNWMGGNFIKTPSSGWNPAYNPTQKTQVWDFTKIWSDETLNGWSDRQELQQGYSSTWATGRWTGYMQMTDGMLAIRNAIAGGTNLSGRIYVQRTSSSGLSTGSKLCLYASDGTTITTTTTINRSQGVWVPLSSAIVEKIKNGSITYFYLKADADNQSTFFKCESNAKIEITYTN